MGIKEIIELVLQQVCEQGWDLIDGYINGNTEEVVGKVYDAIKDEI